MHWLVTYILWIWLTQGRRNILTKIKTFISAHFLAFSLLHQSFLPHPATLSVHHWRLPQRDKLRHVPRSCVRCTAPLDSSSAIFLPSSLFPPPSNLLVPITSTILPTSTPRISNVTAFWVPFQSFPHFLEELFRIELIYFHFFVYLSSYMPLEFLFRGFSEVDG